MCAEILHNRCGTRSFCVACSVHSGAVRPGIPLQFTIEHIKDMAGSVTFERGEQYFNTRRARIIEYTPGQPRFVAEVRGSAPRPYRVQVEFDYILTGSCTCPVRLDCKHAVAAALEWLHQYEVSARAALATGQDPLPAAIEIDSAQTPAAGNVMASPLDEWLTHIPAVDQSADVLEPGNHYLLYELRVVQQQVHVSLKKSYLKKDGQWSQIRPFNPDYFSLQWRRPDHVRDPDMVILQLLPRLSGNASAELSGEAGRLALEHMLNTHRLIFNDIEVSRSTPVSLRWSWQEEEGRKQLKPQLDGRREWVIMAVMPPCYLDTATAQIGEIQTSLGAAQVLHLASMPAVPAERLQEVAVRLRQSFAAEQLPVPVELPEIMDVTEPQPFLTLVSVPAHNAGTLPAALLHFEYAGIRMMPDYDSRATYLPELVETQGGYVRIRRNQQREQAYADQLFAAGLRLYQKIGAYELAWAAQPDTASVMVEFWEDFLADEIPKLEQQGWEVERAEEVDLDVDQAEFDFQMQDMSNHWFELALSLPLGDGRKLDTAEAVEMWLEQGTPDTMIVAVDGGWVRLDTRPLASIRDLLAEMLDRHQLDKPMKLAAFQVAQLQDIPRLNDTAAPNTRRLLQQLKDFNGIEPVPVPTALHASLRSYQQDGLNWLVFLHRYGLGGILADDMGLGKTLQALAFIQYLKEQQQLQKPALIIAPTSLTGNWLHEIHRFTPQLSVTLVHGAARAAAFSSIDKSDVVITTYPLLPRDIKHYQTLEFSVLILDEAQAIKNPTTKVAQSVRLLNSDMRICLTGTPLENHLGELWAIMDFVLPGLLSGQRHFQRYYRQPVEREADHDRQKSLARRVAPFMLRRTKTQVVKELPPKTEIVQYVELEGKQRALYEGIRVGMEKRIRDLVASQGMQRSHIQFLDALLKLRQACIDPRLVKLEKAASVRENAKMEWLNETLPQLLEEGRHVLIFSQFTELLSLIEKELSALQIDFVTLTGQTRKRQEVIDRFQNGEVQVFLVSLKAGGSGLNLTAADVVIHMDPWWNPAVENQATDRAYRIGQDKPVFVYKLVAANTVEERIQQMQQRKQALADNLFNEAGTAALGLDQDALLSLLASDGSGT